MRKLLFGAIVISLAYANSVQAMTKPDDAISVLLEYDDFYSGKNLPPRKKYVKKWKDIKLDAKTRSLINAKNKQFDTWEKFRLHHIMLLNDRLLRAAFIGENGGYILAGMGEDTTICHLTFDGNGGFLGGFSRGCTSAFPMPD